MSNAFPLSPVDVNYLTSNLVYEQLTQNSEAVTLASNTTVATPVSLMLDGSGRGYLTGSVNVTNASPSANQALLSLPANISPLSNSTVPVAVLRAGAYVANAVTITAAGSSIANVVVNTPGVYVSKPTLTIEGVGTGAVLVTHMGALTSTVVVPQASTGSYAATNTITLAGGTSTSAAVLTVDSTEVFSATVAAAGTGGTDGTQTVTGTTGTGSLFTASVTVSGGGITAVLSILNGGSYTVNPTTLTAEPVTGAGLSGAQLAVHMGVLTSHVTTAGSYTVLPANPVAQASSSGAGTGATFNIVWKVGTISVSSGGSGYTEATTLAFSGGSPLQQAVATAQISAQSTGLVSLVNAATQNDVVSLNGVNFFTQSYS